MWFLVIFLYGRVSEIWSSRDLVVLLEDVCEGLPVESLGGGWADAGVYWLPVGEDEDSFYRFLEFAGER